MDSLRLPVFTSIQPLALESAMSTTVRAARLRVLRHRARKLAAARTAQHRLERLERLADGHDVRLDAQVVRQLARIVQGMLRGIGAGKHDAVHVIGAEHVGAQDGDDA